MKIQFTNLELINYVWVHPTSLEKNKANPFYADTAQIQFGTRKVCKSK